MSKDEFAIRDGLTQGAQRGRGAGLNPGNRFETTRLHVLGEYMDHVASEKAAEANESPTTDAAIRPADWTDQRVPTQVFPDSTRSMINHVDSPDQPFSWTINPYRGCEHGCIYCYARPDHERLAMSSGLDFETKIMAKFDAPAILKRELARESWKGESLMMAGVTDCYQPIEREYKITRGCLEVMADCGQPVGIVTKNKLVLRDLDLLQRLNGVNAVRVFVSLTTLDNHLAAKMEPRASSPSERLNTIRELRLAGIPVGVMTAPIIPGLNDKEMPRLLESARDAGATMAGYVLLRLPYQIKDLFLDWLKRHFPDRAAHIESLIRDTRAGELYQSEFGLRKRGSGPVADQINRMFKVFSRKYGFNLDRRSISSAAFRHPRLDGQMRLFE